ncbi:MAG: extracellular solute-binding protein, partial [Pseudomonadota bacterium]|nr:extracellular solute-binding protein [Pseudomonadota bacterium]
MRRGLALALSLALAPICGGAEEATTHGLAMHGVPALPADFTHLPYADPDATPGGRLVLGELGGFDSLNPYILKGRSVWAVRGLMVESLLARSYDEPFTLYGQLAGRVETPPDRSWVEFELREEARFSDGSPVTLDDVIWSMEVLAEKGLPGFRTSWAKVSRTEITGPRSVRFHFDAPDREMPLILGLRPILKKAAFEGRDFAESSMEPLVTSGPYVVDSAEPGRRVVFRKNPDWWGKDLAINAGLWNFDEIRYEWFKDEAARFEAFRAGDIDVFRDGDPARWEEGYGFPAAQRGDVVKAEIPHQRPSGLTGFVFNTRRPIFADIRVRRALAEALDFEWINATLNRGAYARIRSPFGGSPLAFQGAAQGREREILAPFAADLPEGALGSGFDWPRTDGSGRSRRNLREAARLLAEAG